MDVGVHELLAATGDHGVDLAVGVAHHGEEAAADAVHAVIEVLAEHPAEALLALAAGPGAEGAGQLAELDVAEAAAAQALGVAEGGAGVDAEARAGVDDAAAPGPEGGALAQGAVGALEREVTLLQFQQPARLQEPVRLVHEPVPVRHPERQRPRVHVVEPLVERPVLRRVVEDELAVRRHVVRLDR